MLVTYLYLWRQRVRERQKARDRKGETKKDIGRLRQRETLRRTEIDIQTDMGAQTQGCTVHQPQQLIYYYQSTCFLYFISLVQFSSYSFSTSGRIRSLPFLTVKKIQNTIYKELRKSVHVRRNILSLLEHFDN